MIYTDNIRHAIRFAIKTHEVYQKQKRKGKDIGYITHPLTAGIVLATAGAKEDVIVAGILHDTIEDSIEEKKVTKDMITRRFGKEVAELVMSVTEEDKTLSWEERKRIALDHINNFSHDSLLVKSADLIGNISELIDDYIKGGDYIFSLFNAPKDKIIENQLNVIDAILKKWSKNPLADDLLELKKHLKKIDNN